MDLIISLIIGGIVGWLASMVMKTNAQMGWIANVLVGVVGSALGLPWVFWIVAAFMASGGIFARATAACRGSASSVTTKPSGGSARARKMVL